MTPTQIARRSDALYADGTCGMTRRVLCDMVAQRESDLEDARAENAKLRELVITLANCAAGHGCDYCPINGGHGYIGETDMCESVHDCMRELGVEE